MKCRLSVLLVVLLCALGVAQDHAAHNQAKPATMMSGLGDLHHPVSTSNLEAQQFFDQGLRLIYAFNHDEAARSFQRAAELDPKLAMAYWGIAEAVGPNYNDPAGAERFKQAHEAIQKAVDLSGNASPAEKAYIQAMAKRFPAGPNADLRKAAEEYHDAMREVMKQFPDDLDAATLFAESGMNLHPWGLWHPDGTPEAGTEEIAATLESVIRRDPNHVGLTILMVDLDHFKVVNDTHGHLVGDTVLRQIGEVLRHEVRSVDAVARYGGEEFVVVLPETGTHGALVFAERIRVRVQQSVYGEEGKTVQVTVSIGVASFPDQRVTSPDTFLALADAALYRAKADGRNLVRL